MWKVANIEENNPRDTARGTEQCYLASFEQLLGIEAEQLLGIEAQHT